MITAPRGRGAATPVAFALLAACSGGPVAERPPGPTVLPKPVLTPCPLTGREARRVLALVRDRPTGVLAGARIGYRTDEEGPWIPLGVTDAQGALVGVIPDGAVVTPVGFPTLPGEACPEPPEPSPDASFDRPSGPDPTEIVAFVPAAPVCRVTLAATRDGAPASGAWLGFAGETGSLWVPWSRLARADAEGLVSTFVPCGRGAALAHDEDGCPAVGPAGLVEDGAVLAVELHRCERALEGHVRDEAGVGVPGAEVRLVYDWDLALPSTPEEALRIAAVTATTDADGHYRIALGSLSAGAGDLVVSASRSGEPASRVFPAVSGTTGSIDADLTLADVQPVHLRCAGRPGDSCVGLLPVVCTVPGAFGVPRLVGSFDTLVTDGVQQLVAWCPADPRGRGRSLRAGREAFPLSANENVAWVDYRDAVGRVTGRFPPGARRCSAALEPPNLALAAVRGGPMSIQATVTDDAFQVVAVPAGDWEVAWRCGLVTGRVPVTVGADPVDVGVVAEAATAG